MASSLSQSTTVVRKVVIYFLIFSVGLLAFQAIWGLITKEDPPIVVINPSASAYLNPTSSFGKIPRLKIASLPLEQSTPLFSINENKALPSFPASVNVYRINKTREGLGDADNARKVGQILGFGANENKTEDNIMFWENAGLTRSLTYDKVRHIWRYTASLDALEKPTSLQDITYYQNLLGTLSSNLGIVSTEFNFRSFRIDYVAVVGNATTSVSTADEAQFVRIAVYRHLESSTLKDNYRPTSKDEVVYTTKFSEIRKFDYLDTDFEFFVINEADKPIEHYYKATIKEFEYGDQAVYALITAEQAWDKIQANQGYLYLLTPQGDDIYNEYQPLSVREFKAESLKTRVIYLEPDERTDDETTHFLQPFYLFEGVAFLSDGRRAEFAYLTEALSSNAYK